MSPRASRTHMIKDILKCHFIQVSMVVIHAEKVTSLVYSRKHVFINV
eukprot:UN14041